MVDIAASAKLDKPVLLVSLRRGHEPLLVATRNVVRVGEGAEATIIESACRRRRRRPRSPAQHG